MRTAEKMPKIVVLYSPANLNDEKTGKNIGPRLML
jgi:hypothetical protein